MYVKQINIDAASYHTSIEMLVFASKLLFQRTGSER